MQLVFAIADMVIWDMPYGMELAPWDHSLTDAQMETFSQQLACVSRARAHCLVLGVVWHDMARVRQFMLNNGYKDVHPVFATKPQQNTTGMEFIFAVETMVVGYKGGQVRLPPDLQGRQPRL